MIFISQTKENRAAMPVNTGSNQTNRTGLPVRTDLRSGAYQCTSCTGEVVGNQMNQPNCSYCQFV